MEAELIEEQELIEYQCADGSQVIITAVGETISFEDCSISTLQCGSQILEVLHKTTDNHDTNDFIIQAQVQPSSNENRIFISRNIDQDQNQASCNDIADGKSEQNNDSCNVSDSEQDCHKCSECNARFASKKALKYHKKVHVDEAFYACEFCSASKIHWSEMWLHQCSNIVSPPLVCPQCHKTVSKKKQLQIHEEVHELQRRFTSKRMKGYFERKLEDTEEPGVDWGAKPFICGVCGKPFQKQYEVEYHEKLHSGERPSSNVCDKCGMTYVNRNELTKHTAMGCSVQLSRKTEPPSSSSIG